MLALSKLDKQFTPSTSDAALQVLASVNVVVTRVNITAILGPSGCGKTTLLDIIAGLTKPTSGEVVFPKGRPKVGYMFQTASLLPWRNVWDNILVGCEIDGIDRQRYEKPAVDLLTRYGLQEFRNAYPHTLSQGMQQRVSLIRLLLFGAELLLLDEPFSRIDYLSRRSFYRDVRKLVTDEMKTILLVTHDIEEAVLLADRIIVLSPRPGTVIAEFENNPTIDAESANEFGLSENAVQSFRSVWQALRGSAL